MAPASGHYKENPGKGHEKDNPGKGHPEHEARLEPLSTRTKRVSPTRSPVSLG